MRSDSNKSFKISKIVKAIVLIILITVLLGVVGFSIGNNRHNNVEKSKARSISQKHAEETYRGILEAKTKQIQKATKFVDKVLAERIQNTKNDDDVKAANTAISNIKGDDTDTQDIRKAYASVMAVINGSSMDKLQVARSRIANLSNSTLSKELENKFTDKMVTATARDISDTPAYVESQTKPLTKAQLKAKEAEMAKNEAKNKADTDAQVKNAQSASSEDANNEKAWSSNPTVTTESTAPTTNTQYTGQTSTPKAKIPTTSSPTPHAPGISTDKGATTPTTSSGNSGPKFAQPGSTENPINPDTGTQAPNGAYFNDDGWGN